MSRSIVNISPEQAAALLPLLQSIAGSSGSKTDYHVPSRTAYDNSSDSSTANSSFVYSLPDSENHEEYSINRQSAGENEYGLEELLAKKKRNSKSTEAQNFFNVSSYVASSTHVAACMGSIDLYE